MEMEEDIAPPEITELPPPMPIFNVDSTENCATPITAPPAIPPRKIPPISNSDTTSKINNSGELGPPDYEIIERLGRGSFGSVYKAIYKPTGGIVALKKSPASEMQESMGEIEILRECDSPAIVKYYGNEVFEDYLWISMEYCGLGALTDVMKLTNRKKLEESEIAAICKSILIGLEYLHINGKMHRDIKPENILLTSEGNPKLADFGVAGKFSFEDKRTTLTGTPYYIAPEILQENNPGYDAKADVWSLGICAVEFAQGEPPWYNTSPMRVMFLIAANPAPTFNDPTKYSKEFNEFIRACLIKNPQKRASSSDLLMCDFIANSKPPTEALAEMASKAASLIEQSGGLENALKAVQNPPPNPKILNESRMRSPSAPSSPTPPVVVAQSPPKSASPSGPPLTTAQIINSSSPAVAAKPNRRSLTDALFGHKGKEEKDARKEKKVKEKEKDKKEKKDKKDKKDKRKSEHPQITALSDRGTIYARKSQPATSDREPSVDKSYLRSMLSKFFGGGRPSKEELVKKKILNALYEY